MNAGQPPLTFEMPAAAVDENIPMLHHRAPAEAFCPDRRDLLMRTRAGVRVWFGAIFGEAFS